MKTLLRISAVLSFGFFLAVGLAVLSAASATEAPNGSLLGVLIGLVCLGLAFFVGPILLFAAERLGPKAEAK